ncbi:MAG: discoidin domain-containing protein [Akkermansia sp.]
MYSKLFKILGGMFFSILCGYICHPLLFPEKEEVIVKEQKKTDDTANHEDKSKADDAPPAIAVNQDGDVSDAVEFIDDDEDGSVLDTWGTEPPSEEPPAEQAYDENDYQPDDTELVVIEKIKEDEAIPLDPKQQYVSGLCDGKRTGQIKTMSKRIAKNLERESERNIVPKSEEFAPEAWRKPEEIRKTITDRLLKRLGPLHADAIWSYMEDPANRRDVAILQMMRLVGDETIKSIAKKHAGRLVIATLCSDIQWLNGFMYSGPTENMGEALTNLAFIFTRYAELLEDPMAQKIATAGALEFARSGFEPQHLMERFNYYYTSYNEKKLNILFEDLQYWDMRLVVGAKDPWKWGSVKNLTWLRDNVRLPEAMYTGACSQVPYRLRNVCGDSIHGPEYLRCFMPYFDGVIAHAHRDIGGVCGALSHYGTYAALAAGIPASAMGEPGHCAYTVRVQGEWVRCNSIYWNHNLFFNFWKEPAWDYLDLMQTLYTDAHKTMVSDQMVALGDILVERRKQLAAFLCYENAVLTQPLNFPAILKYNAFLKERGADKMEKWLELHDWVLEGICQTHHNAGGRLLSKYIYPNLIPQIDDRRKRSKLFAEFFKQCKTMGTNRWDINALLSEQLTSFKTDKEQVDFMKDTLGDLIKRPDYSGAAMAWGLEHLATIPDTEENLKLKEEFTDVIIKSLSRAKSNKKNEDATWGALGEAIFTASENKDRGIFQAIGKLALKKCKKHFPKNKLKFKGYSGQLLSEEGLIYSDKTIDPGGACCLHWGALQKDGGMIAGKTNVTVELAKTATINGIVVITSTPMDASRGMIFEASEDGQNWVKLGNAEMEGAIIRIDTKKANVKARCIRMSRGDAMIASDMTSGIPVVGFYVYGKKIK